MLPGFLVRQLGCRNPGVKVNGLGCASRKIDLHSPPCNQPEKVLHWSHGLRTDTPRYHGNTHYRPERGMGDMECFLTRASSCVTSQRA